MHKIWLRCLITLVFLAVTTLVIAQDEVDFEIGLEQLEGNSTYQIGGLICVTGGCFNGHFPISKLEFPMDLSMLSIGIEKQIDNNIVRFKIKKDIKSNQGTFKDSDFLTPGSLDIYSESKSDAEAAIISADLEHKLEGSPSSFSTYIGAGITYQNFKFKATDTNQVSSDQSVACTCFIPGLTITYDVTYYIPNVYVRFESLVKGDFYTSAKFAYSPFVSVEDVDIHLARNPVRVSTGDLDGDALEVELSLIYRVNSTTDLQFSFRQTEINADGTQTQVDGNVFNASLDEKVDSTQRSFGIMIRSAF